MYRAVRARRAPLREVTLCVALISFLLGCGDGVPDDSLSNSMTGGPALPCERSETVALGPGVYSFRHGLYSTLFLAGASESGIIAFDPLGSESACLGRSIRATLPGVPVRHVVYSHGHLDHIAGAADLPLSDDVRVYAHRQAVLDIQRQGQGQAVLPVTDPLDVGRDGGGGALSLTLLGRQIDLYYFGPTVSSGNLAIHLPAERVAMLVDVFTADSVPGTMLAAMSPQGVLRTLAALDSLGFDQIVVGHGPPASHKDLSRALSYWNSYVAQAQVELQTPIIISAADALDGSPLLATLPKWPVAQVLEGLRPTFGQEIGFDQWGKNGFNFAYLFLLSESGAPLSLNDPKAPRGGTPPPTRWQKVGPGAYYAQAGAHGSLIFDPDPQGGAAPLLIVDTLGENAAFLRVFLDNNLPGRKIGHIVYSHAHNDHIAFADALADDLSSVHIWAHENAVRDLLQRGNPSVVSPTDVVMGDGVDLQLGSQPGGPVVQLRWFGPSHGDGNLVVNLPSSGVAMGVGLVQKGALPGLLSVGSDPRGLAAALTGMAAFGAQVYLTGEGGYLIGDEFRKEAAAVHDLLVGAAAAMNQAGGLSQPVDLTTPVGPVLRGVVESVGAKVASSLQASYPTLQGGSLILGNLGDLGVIYCSAESPSATACQTP